MGEILKAGEVGKFLGKLQIREELFKSNTFAHPSSQQVERAMAASDGDPAKAALALASDPAVLERAEEVHKSWADTFQEASQKPENEFLFGIWQIGWNNVDAPTNFPTPPKVCPRSVVPMEFFQGGGAPHRLSTEGDTSLVLGTFDDSFREAPALVSAVDMNWAGADFGEEVQPDGTFSLCAVGYSSFVIKTTDASGNEATAPYGPFRAAGRKKVSHLGLLDIT